MSFIAIIGSGALGGAVAHKLAGRDRVGEVRLIDPRRADRAGQGARHPAGRAGRRVQHPGDRAPARSPRRPARTSIVVADDGATARESTAGEAGLALLRQLAALEASAPIVFAGATQRELIARAVSELKVPRRRA